MIRFITCLLFTAFLLADEFDPADNTIVLGKRVGLIKPGMTSTDIKRAYGKKNLKNMHLPGPEGSTFPGAKLFEGTGRELEIVWDPENESKKIVSDIRIIGADWKFENGLEAGLSLGTREFSLKHALQLLQRSLEAPGMRQHALSACTSILRQKKS